MNTWIIQEESGITLVYQSFREIPVDEDLVSGLLAALNQFTVKEFKQGLESIEMAGLRWVYLKDKVSRLLFIAADTKDVSSSLLKARLNVIKQSFLQEYIKDGKEWRRKWNGNVDIYKEFKKTIMEYYMQWKQAENVETIGEFFDILGIFQQLLNLLMNVIEEHASEEEKSIIYQKLERMYTNFKEQDHIKNDPELKKISFDRLSGFNIIAINPNNSNMILTEKQLIIILNSVIRIIKKVLDPKKCILYFLQEKIFDYIVNNYKILRELNLAEYFLRLFLLE